MSAESKPTMEIDKIREHMEVVGSDGHHVGTVDHVGNDGRIKLTRTDPAANNQHHSITVDTIDRVDDAVHLTLKASDALANASVR